jgi:hypothetical protein
MFLTTTGDAVAQLGDIKRKSPQPFFDTLARVTREALVSGEKEEVGCGGEGAWTKGHIPSKACPPDSWELHFGKIGMIISSINMEATEWIEGPLFQGE